MRLLIFSLLFIAQITFAQTKQSLVVASTLWEGYTHEDGGGIYLTLLSEIFSEFETEFQFDIYNRALQSFKSQQADMIVGVYREDVYDAYLPNWFLDTDYPVFAFVKRSNHLVNSINDLKTQRISWVRGYGFGRFIPFKTSPYPVNSADKGFELLAKERIDSFIDYQHNVPIALRNKLKAIEVLPARRIYLAFQNNQRGKKLARIYDQKMVQLRESGKLAQIYQKQYQHSGFAQFKPDKVSVNIFTDELGLIKSNNNQPYQADTTVPNVLSMVIDQLSDFRIEFTLQKDFSDVKRFSKRPNVCFADMIKTPSREQLYYYSEPSSLYMGLRLYSYENIFTEEITNLPELLKKFPNFKIGIVNGRSYGQALDEQISRLGVSQLIKLPASVITSLKLLNKKRFEILIEYPSDMAFYWPQVSKHRLFSSAIDEATPYVLGHLMCSKTPSGKTFINAFNMALTEVVYTDFFYQTFSKLTTPESQQAFNQYFNSVFTKPIQPAEHVK